MKSASSEALLEVAGSIASEGELSGIFDNLLRSFGGKIPFDLLSLVLHDPVNSSMYFNLVAADSPVTLPLSLELPITSSPGGWVWEQQQALVLDNLDQEVRWPEVLGRLRQDGMRSYCLLPLTTATTRLGAIGFASRDADRYGSVDLAVIAPLAHDAALSIENRLVHAHRRSLASELKRERDHMRLLVEAGSALVSRRDLNDLLHAISTCVRRVMPHDYASLSLYDRELRQFRLRALDFPKGKGLIRTEAVFTVEGSPHGRAMKSGKPLFVNKLDARQFPADITTWLLREGIRSACWLPLTRGETCIGVLNVASLRETAFTRHEIELLAQIANQIAIAVENAMAFKQIADLQSRLAEEKDYLQDEIRSEHHYDEVVGESAVWQDVLRQVETVAPTDATVLILGETGTGKELVARAIHSQSRRHDQTFVKLSCAAVPSGLLESELFGHEKGAFTGAIARQVGRFELAHRGTLFLDEVGDIAPELQPKILRALQEQEFERLGSSETKKVDVRVLAATNRNLGEMVANREFREDLYYRLNVFPISLPPLRERRSDIPLLVRYFVHKHGLRMRRRIESIPTATMDALSRWSWPGNVRELENFIERAVILSRGSVLQAPVSELKEASEPETGASGTLESVEREHILHVLRECHGVVSGPNGAAARLGLNRSTLNSRMRKLGISRKDVW